MDQPWTKFPNLENKNGGEIRNFQNLKCSFIKEQLLQRCWYQTSFGTKDGTKRKKLFIERVFCKFFKTKLILNFYISTLPIFKKYVILF